MSGSDVRRWAAWLPVHNPRFWVVQALIALVFVLHQLDAGRLGTQPFTAVPHLAAEALFLLPLLYAALNFGLRGSLATAAWVTLLMTIDITLDLPGMGSMDLWAHYVELATLDVVALVVGRGVETERLARARAEQAETRYRQLYEIACVPILVLDAGGVVRDANPAARTVFGVNVIGQTDQALLPGGFLPEEQAGRVLGLPDGRDYRLSLAPFPAGPGTASTQVIFENVTEEHRERRRATRYAALVVQAEEDQRRRLARELHDEPLQLFLHLARRLESLADAPGVPAAVASRLAEARHHALDAAARLRSLTRELRPSVLDQLGLAAAISSFHARWLQGCRRYRHHGHLCWSRIVRLAADAARPNRSRQIRRPMKNGVQGAVRHISGFAQGRPGTSSRSPLFPRFWTSAKLPPGAAPADAARRCRREGGDCSDGLMTLPALQAARGQPRRWLADRRRFPALPVQDMLFPGCGCGLLRPPRPTPWSSGTAIARPP